MITSVTLNASIDKAYLLASPLVPGTVMRVKEVRNSAGGKGLNVARAVQLCGQAVLATGLVGGFNGAYLESLLSQDQIPFQFTHINGETRSCVNVLEDSFGSTEFLEKGCAVSEDELDNFFTLYKQILDNTEVVTLSGSLPAGVPEDTYQKLILVAKEAKKKVILDSSGKAFQTGLKAQPTLVKPNKEELEALFQTSINSREEIILYAQKLLDQGLDYVVVSLGGEGAIMLHNDKVYQGLAPKIKPVNTVGCGDSMVGALAIGLKNGSSPEECLRYAIAVGTANALSPFTGRFAKEDLDWAYENASVSLLNR